MDSAEAKATWGVTMVFLLWSRGWSAGQRRLHFEHVDPGAAQIAAVQRVGQGLGVHHGSPRYIDEVGAALHPGNGRPADEPSGVVVQGAVEGDDIGPGK